MRVNEIRSVPISRLVVSRYQEHIQGGKLSGELVAAAKQSINQDVFWQGFRGRLAQAGRIELLFGAHRLRALQELYPKGTFQVQVVLAPTTEEEAVRLLVNENADKDSDRRRDGLILVRKILTGALILSEENGTCPKKGTCGEIREWLGSDIWSEKTIRRLLEESVLKPGSQANPEPSSNSAATGQEGVHVQSETTFLPIQDSTPSDITGMLDMGTKVPNPIPEAKPKMGAAALQLAKAVAEDEKEADAKSKKATTQLETAKSSDTKPTSDVVAGFTRSTATTIQTYQKKWDLLSKSVGTLSANEILQLRVEVKKTREFFEGLEKQLSGVL